MREILFRGKRIDNGEWLEGYLTYRYHYCEQSEKEILWPVIDWPHELTLGKVPGIVISPIKVIPDTVGQFTGLTDKNGEKIFEGDIIRCWYHRDGKEDLVTVEQVVFHQGAFVAHATNGTAKWWVHLPNNDGCKPLDKVYLREVEVIGNIHDNPELIGGGRR